MNAKPLVYLAGPITGTSYGECTDWREYVKREAAGNFVALSPMRHKEYLASETSVADSYEQHVMSCSRGIMTRDYFDCTRADMVLVNLLGATKVSVGTVMEIGFAYAHRIPIVLVIDEKNVHRHSMVKEAAGFVLDNLDDAISVVERVLLPELPANSITARRKDTLKLLNAA